MSECRSRSRWTCRDREMGVDGGSIAQVGLTVKYISGMFL